MLLARLCIVAVAVCALFSRAQAAGPPYDIHVLVEQTGAFAFNGAKQVQVLGVLEQYVNDTGGIRGRPVHFVFHDDTTNPQVAVQITNQLIAQRVPVILGPSLSAVCSAVFPILEKAGPVEWCYSPVVRPAPGSYTFMGAPLIADVQPVVVRYFYGRGARNFALITSTDATGQIFDSTFEDALNRLEFRGAKLVAHERFNTTDLSVAAQMTRIKAAKPDVVISYTSGTPFGTVLHGMSDAGLDVPVYGSGANMNVNQMEQYSSFLPKEVYLNAAQGLVQDPRAPEAVKKRQAVFFAAMKRAGIHVEYSHSLTWDPSLAVIEALRTLGPDATAAQLHDYLEHLRSWVGIQGVYNFATGDQRGLGENGAAVFRWNGAKKDFDMVATGPKFL
jgi:branched-chain amino acid transport system substrate-binding protein